jgi:hypothetical protein
MVLRRQGSGEADVLVRGLQLEARRLELSLEPRLRQPHMQLEGLACAMIKSSMQDGKE